MRTVVLDGYTANPGDLCWDKLKEFGECVIYDRTAPAEVLERAAGAEALLTNKVVINSEMMAALPDLKYIGVLATGYNVVDIAAARERGIIVTNIPAYSTPSVGQMVFAHILNITQQVRHYSEEVSRGDWSKNPDFCFYNTPLIELLGKKIGIIGLGQTGYNTARIAIGFGMKVWAYTSKSRLLPPNYNYTESQLTETLRKRKDTFRRYRDLSIFAFIGVYLLSVVDAYVDAELSNFDITPDLSMKVEPAIINSQMTGSSNKNVGVQCSFRF